MRYFESLSHQKMALVAVDGCYVINKPDIHPGNLTRPDGRAKLRER